jgi:hypothetical protein
MRLWEFDRLGAIASEQLNVNQDGLQFVSIVLGFLRMSNQDLGFDPTITTTADGRRFISIEWNGQAECFFLESPIKRALCIAGRATTCWKAYREGDDQRTTFVVKDSWQYTEQDEEGELLRAATEKDVVNVARYYHHETVRVASHVDDVHNKCSKRPRHYQGIKLSVQIVSSKVKSYRGRFKEMPEQQRCCRGKAVIQPE